MIDIYVPSHGKTRLPILKMLEDKDIRLIFCIRNEEIADYNRILLGKKNVKILNLGTGIHDIGETRRRIQYVSMFKNNEKYCIMFDDGISWLHSKSNPSLFPSRIIKRLIATSSSLKYADKLFALSFWKSGNNFLGVKKTDKYLAGMPLQAVILNNGVCLNNHLWYQSMDIVGLEDCAFMIDGLKKGLLTYCNQDYLLIGKHPNKLVKGGNHESIDKDAFEKERDESCKKLLEYEGPTYGLTSEKKYRKAVGAFVQYVRIDFEYFRNVLIDNRDINKKLIQSHFKIGA